MEKYFKNTQLLENTLLPYLCESYPLILLNKKFSTLDYEKYNTLIEPNGALETYYIKTKTLESKVSYKNGNLDGLTEIWYNDGKSWERCNYKYNIKHGLYEMYWDNGQIAGKVNYKDGKLEGLCKEWYENGKLTKECNYKDGNPEGRYKKWYKTGKLAKEYNYKNGAKDGLCGKWVSDGTPTELLNYKDGLLNGTCVQYSEGFDGNLVTDMYNYKNREITSNCVIL